MVWLVYAVLAAVALALVAAPFLKRKPAASVGLEHAEDASAPSDRKPLLLDGRVLTGIGLAAVAAAAAVLYAVTSDNHEEVAASPAAGAASAVAPGQMTGLPDVDTMIDRLAKRLQTQPNDLEGWRMLGWSYLATQKYPDAVKAYGQAVSLAPKNAAVRASYAEALVKAAGDKVGPDAEKALNEALALDPQDPRAQVYRARLKCQKGQCKPALEDLFAILKLNGGEGAMGQTIKDAIRKIAADSGIDVSGRLPTEADPSGAAASALPGPTAADVQAAQALPPQQQQAMIEGMVARLETRLKSSPKDVDGWIMLMRSHQRMGQLDKAKAAFGDARQIFKGDAGASAKLDAAAQELGLR